MKYNNITENEITKNWDNKTIPLVSIVCNTYNHQDYITDAINGFLIQKTDFPFEILINDDCSPDNTQTIIKEYAEKYPAIIKPIFNKKNKFSQGIDTLFDCIANYAKGKYVAICEGDDFWIDPNKLQMQVEFMEKNSDYGMSFTKTKQYIHKKNTFLMKNFGTYRSFESLIKDGNSIPTLTTVIRKDLCLKFIEQINPDSKRWLMGDLPLWIFISNESKIKFFNKVTSVYRILEKSASHDKDIEKKFDFLKCNLEIRLFFAKKYNRLDLFNENVGTVYENFFKLKYNYDEKLNKELQSAYKKIKNPSFITTLKYFICKTKIIKAVK
ncbi:MAG: glycosyltransferase family 2 protein [Treponemataceae bacterium]